MKNKLFLILIIALAFVLRFWNLGSFPPLNADEAALGYNAYSLIQTSLDEHGNSWPIHFQSFNDFKPGLMVYLILPFVKVLGLTVWAVRIPGALAGVGTVVVIYYLTKELQRKVDQGSPSRPPLYLRGGDTFALVSALFLAISPWHIHFSRGGWEVNVATFLMTLGLWMFLRGTNYHSELSSESRSLSGSKKILKQVQDNKIGIRYLLLSMISFVLALYTYHAARVVVPLLGLGLVVFNFKKLLVVWKKILIVGFVGLILLIPLIRDLTGPAGISRAAGVGIFSDPGPLNEINEQRGEHGDLTSLSAKLLHNKPINYAMAIAENWLEHYHGEFLFLSGDDIQRNKVPEHGQMYMIDALFVIVGAFSILKLQKGKIVLYWLLIAPVAAALTFQSPHALRSQNMVIPLVIISAFGFVTLVDWISYQIKSRNFRGLGSIQLPGLLYGFFGLLIVWSFARYQYLYWVHMPREYPFSSQYGFEELMSYVNENYDRFDKIIITDRYDQPYILTLFYLNYPPEQFQHEHELSGRDGFGFSTVRNFDKFQFVSLGEWSDIVSNNQNTLIVGTDEEVPDEANIVREVLFPNGKPAFQIVEN